MSYAIIYSNKKSLRWIDVTNPKKKDVAALQLELPILQERDVNEALRPTLRSTIAKRKEYLLMVVMVPVYNAKIRSVQIREVDLIIGKDFLVTIHQTPIPAIDTLFSSCVNDTVTSGEYMNNGGEYLLYKLLEDMLDSAFPVIDLVNNDLEQLKEIIFNGENTPEIVEESLVIRRNITDLRKGMRGHANVLQHLVRHEQKDELMAVKETAQFIELIAYADEIWAMLESEKELIEALEDANEALISHGLNNTISRLTAFSFILLPSAVIAGIFGMNTQYMPIIGHPFDFWILLFGMAVMSMILFLLLWKKKLL